MAEHVCPWWIGYLLVSPLRRIGQNPLKILAPYLEPGMVALDVGCGMGFFSLDMARLVGPEGKVVCVDLQERMIRSLVRRAAEADLLDRIEHRVCGRESLGLKEWSGKIDFALAFAIVHEVPDAEVLFKQIYEALRPGAACLVAEPKGHVSERRLEETVAVASGAGFEPAGRPAIRRSRAVLLKR